MKLSISNIAWDTENDHKIYALMQQYGYTGLEIAPTRIFPKHPYKNLKEAACWAENIYSQNGFVISSMQSVWYGREEHLFGTLKERQILLAYTKEAVDFAAAIRCKNIVFGCPKNRVLPKGMDPECAVSFFKEIGDYAAVRETVIGMEANPAVYHTNYINRTEDAFELVECVGSKGFQLNLDVGTMIHNGETVDVLKERVQHISHVHISEPGLGLIQKRQIHKQLYEILHANDYKGYLSVEMSRAAKLNDVERVLAYVGEVFWDK